MDNLFIIRHAATEWSESGQHTGTTDLPLTEKGKQEAMALDEVLKQYKFDHILLSPLQRAVETAKIAGIRDQCTLDPDLVEWNYGDYEGLTSEQIHEKDPTWNIFTKGGPHGETVAQACARADRVLVKVQKLNGNVGLVSSGHFSRLLTTRFLHLPPIAGNILALSTATLSKLGIGDSNFPSIIFWNCHHAG